MISPVSRRNWKSRGIKKFHSGIMGKSEEKYDAKEADIRNYAKYLLSEGNIFEKRDLLTRLKTKIILTVKK